MEDRTAVQGDFEILRSKRNVERERWLGLWHDSPGREPFAHPAYVDALLLEGQTAVCACQSSLGGSVMLPMIVRPIVTDNGRDGTSLCDCVTPYGYGGAFYWGVVDCDKFWDGLENWANQIGVVTLFARLSLFPETTLPFRGQTRHVMDNIVRSIGMDDASLWMDYEQKVRKNVNKALRSEVSIEWDYAGTKLEEFEAIYASTLDRRGASEGYYFSRNFFRQLIDGCPESLVFVHAIKDGNVISTELVLVGRHAAYSFLGGTLAESFELRPNDLLKHEIFRWCREQGKANFVLGGGISADDGIVRYKSSFAPHDGRVPFFVGERVFNPDANEGLNISRQAADPTWTANPNYFPTYRSP